SVASSSVASSSVASSSAASSAGGSGAVSKGRRKRMAGSGRQDSSSAAAAAAAAAGPPSSRKAPQSQKLQSKGSAGSGSSREGRGRSSKAAQDGAGGSGSGSLFAMAGRSLRSLSRTGRSSRATSAALDLQFAAASGPGGRRGDSSSHSSGGGGGGGGGGGRGPGGDTDSLTSSGSSGSSSAGGSHRASATTGERILAVTSSRSDAYHDQRALSSTSKLPRRAPSALKTFHELAVGVRDAYEAGGCTPAKPPPEGSEEASELSTADREHRRILFEFFGNLDFLLALVDEVAIDTATRGALKEDGTFRGVRDVIKKCNKVRARAVRLARSKDQPDHALDEADALVMSLLNPVAFGEMLGLESCDDGLGSIRTSFCWIYQGREVLDSMLVRRERKYTLLFRVVRPEDAKMTRKIAHWNARVEKALGGVVDDDGKASRARTRAAAASNDDSDANSDAGSVESSATASSSASSAARSAVSSAIRRGRELLPTAGKVRARRATPTPRLRRQRSRAPSAGSDTAGEDGYSSDTVPLDAAATDLARLQLSLDTGGGGGGDAAAASSGGGAAAQPPGIRELRDKKKRSDSLRPAAAGAGGPQAVQPMKPKDELLDVIRGLRTEQMRAREAVGGGTEAGAAGAAAAGGVKDALDEIKSNFAPKAEIPSAVPKLPTEYIHRHRLMKQVVNCLLDRNAGPRDTDEEAPQASGITCITSRHSDKAGNGKTTLAVAAIQTVEVREAFADGIAWIRLGRTPLGEREVRRLYEQLYEQLLGGGEGGNVEEEDEDKAGKEEEEEDDGLSSGSDDEEGGDGASGAPCADDPQQPSQQRDNKDPPGRGVSTMSSTAVSSESKLAPSRRSFQGGELEGMKEDLARLILPRRVLICLDDVCKMEDAKWFLFGTKRCAGNGEDGGGGEGATEEEDGESPHRVLMTTRVPGLSGPGVAQEVFVRIFSEHEAVKLLLTAAGRRPNGLPKVSPVFAQARIVVKGCGNSPMALRVAGGMLRSRNRNWTLSSPAWKLLVEQCRTSLEEASRIRSFANSVRRLVDLSFATVPDPVLRDCLRRCFVAFALVFHDTDSLKAGKGISRAVVARLFAAVSAAEGGDLLSPAAMGVDELADHMDNAAVILDTLETMNLIQRAGHALSKSFAMVRLRDAAGDDGAGGSSHSNHKYYSMYESIKAIAEDMSKRKTEAFAPVYDEFNSFTSKTIDVPESSGPPFPFDECMVTMLTDEDADAAESVQSSLYERWNIEEYIAENLPLHLVRAGMVERAAEVLVQPDFCTRRVVALGSIEATRQHMTDLVDLRRASSHHKESSSDLDFNIVDTVQEGSACMIDEVRRQPRTSSRNVDVAICLSTVGEGLIKARQPRDASQRLEEAAALYRELLGQGHIDVARAVNAVAKSLVKIGETRAALIRFGEASSTYEDCDASRHYDAIANLQGMANLFVTSGDFQAATALYENVIGRRQAVHGEFSVATAKTINDYAVALAKNGRMDDALARYEKARVTYERALDGLPPSMSWLNHGESAAKCGFDMSLINLNIASIKSKKGDVAGAINSYEVGVRGLRKYKEELALAGDEAGKNKNSSHMRHLVSALGRIGSLKLKQGDRNGALEAYASLFKEVDNAESPTASRLEKAKAHIKCATIYRQNGERDDNKHAIVHLREALNMYTDLYGAKHKDTIAVATSLQQWMEEEQL
ncbi:hypothetical protein ACHAWF_015590, partial [Thalassiosira exigua]